MPKFVFALAVLVLAAPVRALDVWCSIGEGDDANLVTLHYSGASVGPVRGMAFDITVDNGEISDVQCLSAAYGYQIFPGSIDIDSSGNVSDWGSCKCRGDLPGTLDSPNAITIEMAAMYEDGVDPDPCDAGDLVSFRIVNPAPEPAIMIAVNQIRGGVVNEDASQETAPNLIGCWPPPPPPCLCAGDPGYDRWSTTLGRPDCWCYRRQCRGDADGLLLGPIPVSLNDLTILRGAINKLDAQAVNAPTLTISCLVRYRSASVTWPSSGRISTSWTCRCRNAMRRR